ncbi:MAG: DUF4197 family protein [Pseudomonadota bacterium]|nr:DUF4197 family protein [Pseudomonadota bacterium]
MRKALTVGTERVVQTIGKADGFNKDPEVHISLPDTLKQVKTVLQAVGMGQ